jgi:hypothetical protein
MPIAAGDDRDRIREGDASYSSACRQLRARGRAALFAAFRASIVSLKAEIAHGR